MAPAGKSEVVSVVDRDWWRAMPPEELALYQEAGYAVQEEIRGKAALLVIDVTKNFTGSKSLPSAEAIREFPTSCGETAWRALPHVRTLLDGFRAASLPVVYTSRDVAAQNAVKGSSKRVSAGQRDQTGNDWVSLVAPLEDEWVCTKSRASAFYGTPLDVYFRVQGVTVVVICGSTTSGCVRASATDAYSAGYQVVVVDDACFDRARTPHLANLFDLNAKYATVVSADEVVGLLGLHDNS